MKHENAKEKWCPMTSGAFSSKCVASDCMSWRWINQVSGFCGLCGPLVCTAGSGIIRPADISEAEIALVDRFVSDCCLIGTGGSTEAAAVFARFIDLNGQCMSAKRFGQIIIRNCERIKRGGVVYYKGLLLV
jgi:hypothetical protein